MTDFKPSDAMVEAGVKAYFEADVDHQNQAMRAAFEASGLVEENSRLRERVSKLESCIKVIRLGHDTGKFEPLQTAIEFAEQHINKEPTP